MKHLIGKRCIVVLPRGWVYVGIIEMPDETTVVLSEAQNVRRWGTSSGLGELAASGPLQDTILDPIPGGISFHVFAVISAYPCAPERWG